MARRQFRAYRSVEGYRYVARVGRRLAEHRFAAELSQRQLAQLVGCSQRSIGLWEDGEVMPRVDAQLALARVFGVSPDELFCFARLPGEQ
jgi:transcriptional regulator with XRE-family HTH domain